MPDESKENQKTLKGGISYYTYIWRTEPGACDTCEELDGTEYTSVDDIPNKPHPNCKCYIDVIENNEDEEENDNDEENNTDEEYSKNDNSNYDDESDDDRKEYYDLTDEAIGDCDSLIDEIQTAIDEFKNQLSDNYFENVKDKTEENIEQLRDYLNELFNISFLLKDLYFNIQEIELKEIKRQLDDINDKINSIKNTVQEIYNNAKSEIENGIMKNRLANELKQTKNTIIQKSVEFAIGKHYNSLFHNLASNTVGRDTAGMLDLSHGINMNDRNYIKDVIHIDNYNDPKVNKDREYLKKKISEQFKDYNFDINKIKGYFFKSNSEPVQRLIKNKDFQEIIKNHKDEIIQKREFSDGFKKHDLIGLGIYNNFHNAIGKADFRNIYQDKEGNLHIKMYDTYDFNKNEDNAFVRAGADQMEKGNLKPFFSIYDIIIPKNKLDEIWK